jgi:hypothetical protein
VGSAGDARRHPGRGTGGSSNAADVDPTPATLGNGVRFRETITGSLRVSGVSRTTRLTLHAHIAGGRNFLHDPNHPISLSGTIDIEGLTTARAATGTLELFPD